MTRFKYCFLLFAVHDIFILAKVGSILWWRRVINFLLILVLYKVIVIIFTVGISNNRLIFLFSLALKFDGLEGSRAQLRFCTAILIRIAGFSNGHKLVCIIITFFLLRWIYLFFHSSTLRIRLFIWRR